jgi:hypothetical protein
MSLQICWKVREQWKKVRIKTMNKREKMLLAYRFVEISLISQPSILTKYDLLIEEDKGKKYIDIIDKIIERAEQKNCLHKFSEDVYKYHKNKI